MSELEYNEKIKVGKEAFKKRIEALRDKVIEGEIDPVNIPAAGTVLSREILIKVYNDVLERIKKGEFDPEFLSSEKKALVDSNKISYAQALSNYFKRKKTMDITTDRDIRSFGVTISESGDFSLFCEPKSKLNSGEKHAALFPAGGSKSCKVCFEVSNYPFMPCASLVEHVPLNSPNINAIQYNHDYEVTMNNIFADSYPEFFSKITTVTTVNDKEIVFHSYMEHIEYSLFFVVNSAISQKDYKGEPKLDREVINFGKKEVQVWQLDTIDQILTAVEIMHISEYNHNDIKLENVLYQIIDGRGYVKIIDMGMVKHFTEEASFQGTPFYMSPELLLLRAEKNVFPNTKEEKIKYLKNLATKNGAYKDALGLESAIKLLNNTNETFKSVEKYTQGQADAWALGILFCEILKIKPEKLNPSESKLHELIAGLLNPNPEKRLTVALAREHLQKLLPEKLKTERVLPEKILKGEVSFKKTNLIKDSIDAYQRYFLDYVKNTQEKHSPAHLPHPDLDKMEAFDKFLNKMEAFDKYIDQLAISTSGTKEYDPECVEFVKDKLANILFICNAPSEQQKISAMKIQIDELYSYLQKIWDAPYAVKNKKDEDLWVATHEKRLIVNFALQCAYMAEAAFTANDKEINRISEYMHPHFERTAKMIEAHQQMPFQYRFTKDTM